MRIAVAGGMSRSAWAGAATTARSDDREFQAESVRAPAAPAARLASLPIVDVRRLARDERADFAAFLKLPGGDHTRPPEKSVRWCQCWRPASRAASRSRLRCSRWRVGWLMVPSWYSRASSACSAAFKVQGAA
jgi:hypothetical protein